MLGLTATIRGRREATGSGHEEQQLSPDSVLMTRAHCYLHLTAFYPQRFAKHLISDWNSRKLIFIEFHTQEFSSLSAWAVQLLWTRSGCNVVQTKTSTHFCHIRQGRHTQWICPVVKQTSGKYIHICITYLHSSGLNHKWPQERKRLEIECA